MAGAGWSRRGLGVPLHQRLRAAPDGGPVWPARHCWVTDPVDGQGVARPGLLLEWRRDPRGWHGRVAYAAQLRPGSWVLVEEWLPGDRLRPDPAQP